MTPEARPLVFLGTPDAAATILRAVLDAGIRIEHVITRPDTRRGRGNSVSASPVKAVAIEYGIDVSYDLGWISANESRGLLGIVVAYGRIIPESMLSKTPMINVHFSLLPRWRGAAPVERAILAGDTHTGVCIMEVEPTLDTGDVYACREMELTDTHTSDSLTKDLARLGGDLLVDVLRNGLQTPTPQDGATTYAHKLSSEEGRIDWNSLSVEVSRHVRALRAFTVVDGQRVRVLEVEVLTPSSATVPGEIAPDASVDTADGAVRLVMVHPEGKGPMTGAAWLRGKGFDAPLICE
ncbi:unannotated protein [freshwater metagenome]|uniref:methionyl-tRNA formyltransferase n=1 Tax=freshwater metagenome TaxID=449393 RepID=A0A6J6H1U1_9ZZZZ|nr:methionyl-tRNA formyltransferase [Actinomycetota bacterium]